MAGRLTIWGANQLLLAYFTKTTDIPTNFYLALIREIAPTPYVSGSELDEPDNAEYARVAIPNIPFNWSNASSPQEVANTEDVEFPTAVTDWGDIRYWALCNASVDGFNFLIGDLETPVQIMAGDSAVFKEGDLSVELGPFYMEAG